MWGNNQMFGMGGFDPSMMQRLGGLGGMYGGQAAPPQGLGMIQNAIQARPGGFSGLGMAPGGGGSYGAGAPMGQGMNLGQNAASLGNPGALGMMAEKLKAAQGLGIGQQNQGPAPNPGGFGQFANPAAMQDPRNRRARQGGGMAY